MSDTPQNEQVIEQVEVVSVDDVAKIVDDATSSAGSEAVEAIGSEVAEVSGKVDSVGDYVAGIDARLAKVEEGLIYFISSPVSLICAMQRCIVLF